MGKGLVGRLKALERRAGGRGPDDTGRTQSDGPGWRSDAEWLAVFEQLGVEGFFDGEPDLPAAIAVYREAVRANLERPDPIRDLPEWFWIADMYERVCDGVPPVTEAEFNELADWFEAHAADLPAVRGSIDLGDGRNISAAGILYGIRRGARSLHTTAVVEQLREIRDRFGSPA